ncbi:MAG: hypothetical protein WAV30_04575 [Microgenomates group bacterium]
MGDTPEVVQKEIDIDIPLIVLVLLFVLLTFFPLYKQHGSALKLKMQRLLNRNSHVVILSTYGPSVEGSPFYEAYVKKAVRYMMDPTNKVNELIIVGGYTVDPDRSQSQAVLDYMMQKYPEFEMSKIPVTLDECGITTWQNIRNTQILMNKNAIKAKNITIFAETSREKKIAFFANSTFHWDAPAIINTKKVLSEINPLISASQEAQLNAFSSNTAEWARFAIVKDTYLIDKDIRIISEPSGLPQQFVDAEYAKLFEEIKEFYDSTYASKAIKAQLDEWTKIAGFDTAENLVQKGCTEYKQYLNK